MTPENREIVITVNGNDQRADVPVEMKLLEFLRETLSLTGTKCGCGYGACGACTVLLDGAPVRSCTVSVQQAAGRRVQTIEGLAQEGRLDPVQEAFLEHGAFQCGFCTPGMILETCGFLATLDGKMPDKKEVQRALRRHICRCGSYQRILAAVMDAAARNTGSTR